MLSESAGTREAAMSVENDVHHRPPITVADGSGAKPAGAPGKPGPARPAPGNANSTVRALPPVKPDPPNPKRALSREIDVGLGDIRIGNFPSGASRIANGIGNVVMYLTGKKLLATYAEAKPATDEILAAYSRRPPADVREVVVGINKYLQGIVIDGLILARSSGDASRLIEALETANRFVTDAGHDTGSRSHRLDSMIKAMREAGVSPFIIAVTETACEEAFRSKP